jgi:hypothetical protein
MEKKVGFDVEVIEIIEGDKNSTLHMGKILEEGFEPFAVIPVMRFPQSTIAQAQPKPILVERVWFKRRVEISPQTGNSVVESSLEENKT